MGELKNTIIRIESDGSRGTGFIINKAERLILTCAHVVPNINNIKVQWANLQGNFAQESEAKILEIYPEEDIALLQVWANFPEHSEEFILASAQNSKGHSFETRGFPANSATNSLTIGGTILSVNDNSQQGFPRIVLDDANAVDNGVSGSPILDTELNVIVGMIDAKTKDSHRGENIAFGIPMEFIKGKIQKINLIEIENKKNNMKPLKDYLNEKLEKQNGSTHKEEILALIESDIDKALEKLDEFFEDKNGAYNDLAQEYYSQPNNFSMNSYRSKLKAFVRRNIKN